MDMIAKTFQIALPETRQVFSTLPTANKPLPFSSEPDETRRNVSQFPPLFMRVLDKLTDGRYRLNFAGVAPEYNIQQDMLYLIAANRFNDDAAAWHGLFHEAAHRYQHVKYGAYFTVAPETAYIEMLIGIPESRAKVEMTADLAAWLARSRVGLPADASIVHSYVNGWGQIYQPVPMDAHYVDLIAADMVQVYNEVSANVQQ